MKRGYYAIYRCMLCNKEFKISDKPTELNEDDIPTVIGAVLRKQQFIGTCLYDAPIILPHKCGNGNGGVANLIGFKAVD